MSEDSSPDTIDLLSAFMHKELELPQVGVGAEVWL